MSVFREESVWYLQQTTWMTLTKGQYQPSKYQSTLCLWNISYFFLPQRLGCDNILESPQQEDPCLQCGGNGQSCHRVKNSFSARELPTGTLHVFYTGTQSQRCWFFCPSSRSGSEFVAFCSLHVWKELCLICISGYNQMFIIPVGATTISIRETVATRNYLGEDQTKSFTACT